MITFYVISKNSRKHKIEDVRECLVKLKQTGRWSIRERTDEQTRAFTAPVVRKLRMELIRSSRSRNKPLHTLMTC